MDSVTDDFILLSLIRFFGNEFETKTQLMCIRHGGLIPRPPPQLLKMKDKGKAKKNKGKGKAKIEVKHILAAVESGKL